MSCEWPDWLDKHFSDPGLVGNVHIFTHPAYGQVYAIGPSGGATMNKNEGYMDLYWYDSKGEWIDMDKILLDKEEAKKILESKNSLEKFLEICKNSPLYCADVHTDARNWREFLETYTPQDAAKIRARELWWKKLQGPICAPKPTKRCVPPKFITLGWVSRYFGFDDPVSGRRIFIPLSNLHVEKYFHPQFGTLYLIGNIYSRDAPYRWFDESGRLVELPREKEKRTEWQALCHRL